eukprot:2786509-Prymnesium_polylepis.1
MERDGWREMERHDGVVGRGKPRRLLRDCSWFRRSHGAGETRPDRISTDALATHPPGRVRRRPRACCASGW